MPFRQTNDSFTKKESKGIELATRPDADPRLVAGVCGSQPDSPRASQVAELRLEKDGDIFVVGGLVIFAFGG